MTLGQRVADRVSAVVGSWRFVLTQSFCLLLWLVLNSVTSDAWDPYPFILLNLALSFQAAYTAPIIMMASNRAAELDRSRASDLHEKVDHIRLQQMFTVWEKVIEMDGETSKGRQVIVEMRELIVDLSQRMQRMERRIDELTRGPFTATHRDDRKESGDTLG